MSLNNRRKRVADRVTGANLCCEESHERQRGIGGVTNYSVAGSPQSKTRLPAALEADDRQRMVRVWHGLR
jgi:hypothetical protein